MADASTALWLEQTLEKLSRHLDQLAGQVCEVEDALGAVFSAAHARQSLSITKLQSLDFIRQSLEDSALLVHFLSKESSTNMCSTAKILKLQAKLKLNSTQSLLPMAGPGRVDPEKKSDGEIDLF